MTTSRKSGEMSGRRLNVLLQFPHFNTLEQASNLRSWQIGRFLARQGHRVTVMAPGVDLRSGELFSELRGKLYHTQNVEGVRLVRVRTVTHLRRSALRRLAFEVIYANLAFLRGLFIRPLDVVVVSYPPAVIPVYGLLLARVRRVPLIFEMRDLMADALEATGYIGSRVFIRFARAAEGLVIRGCQHIIAVSNGIKRFVAERGVNPAKISVVTNGYEPEPFIAARKENLNPRDEFGWGNSFVVIYAGGLTQSYDIPTMLRAAERLRERTDVRFVLVGEGDRKEEYQAFCRKRCLENVQFIGYQPRKLMPRLLEAADLGVHMFPDNPVWAYVLGNKLFDYFGSGLPVVYAGTGDMAELIEVSGGGFVIAPENDEALAKRIVYLESHRREAQQMAAKGEAYVKRHYNRQHLLKDFEEILIAVAENGTQIQALEDEATGSKNRAKAS